MQQLQYLLVPVDVVRQELQVFSALAFVGRSLLELAYLSLGTDAGNGPGDVNDEEDDVEDGDVDGTRPTISDVVRLRRQHSSVLVPVACRRLNELEDEERECSEDTDSFEPVLHFGNICRVKFIGILVVVGLYIKHLIVAGSSVAIYHEGDQEAGKSE